MNTYLFVLYKEFKKEGRMDEWMDQIDEKAAAASSFNKVVLLKLTNLIGQNQFK